jgi:hypothetical protein
MIIPLLALVVIIAVVIYFITRNAKNPDQGQNGETL